jgi:hypothetical protein
MTPIAIKVVFGHQALPYARLDKGFLNGLFYSAFLLGFKLVDLQQTRFAVRMTVAQDQVRNHGALYTRLIEIG